MGSSKADLPWAGSTLAVRVATALRAAVTGPVIVIGAPGQQLPQFPEGVEVGTDAIPGGGPLEGLASGLELIGDRAQVAFLAATDMPLLHPAFVRRVLGVMADPEVEIALPFVGGYRQPLAAGYRVELAPRVRQLLATGQRRPGELFHCCRGLALTESDLLADRMLSSADPDLVSVLNLNDPASYESVRARYEQRAG